jgi:hypothetical protein
MTTPTNQPSATLPGPAERTALLIQPTDHPDHDGEPVAWFGPILNHLARPGGGGEGLAVLPAAGLELWIDSPHGSEPVPSPWRCDTGTDIEGDIEDGGYCDAPAVACVGVAWTPVCAAHLPSGVTVPPVDSLGWRVVSWVDDPGAIVDQYTALTLAAFAFCEANTGYNVADLLSAGLRQAATTLGSAGELVSHRPGSWEADHLAALAATANDW